MSQHTLARRILVIGVPIAFAVISVFHPMPEPIAGLADDVSWWITLHVLQIPMFLLMGCAILTLGWASSGRAITVSRMATLVFIAFYPAYDAFAGLGSGYLVQHAEGTDAATRSVLYEAATGVFDSPINTGLYVVGTLAWMVAVVSLGVALRVGPGGRAVDNPVRRVRPRACRSRRRVRGRLVHPVRRRGGAVQLRAYLRARPGHFGSEHGR